MNDDVGKIWSWNLNFLKHLSISEYRRGLLLTCMCEGVDLTFLVYDNAKPHWEHDMAYFIKKTWSECGVCVLLLQLWERRTK